MLGKRIRRGARGTSVVALVSLTAVVPVVLMTRHASEPFALLSASQVVASTLLLLAAVLVYIHWRLDRTATGTDRRLAGWLTIGLVVASLHGLVPAALLGAQGGARNVWPTVGATVVLALLTVVAAVCERAEPPGDPAVAGVAAGVVLSMATAAATEEVPLVVAPFTALLLATLGLLTALVLAWVLLHRRQVSPWVRHRLALAAVLAATGQFVGHAQIERDLAVAAAGGACLIGSATVWMLTHVLFRRAVAQQQREVAELQRTLEQSRAAVLLERELLHEVGSTVAGITTASKVMRQESVVSPQRRARLSRLVEEELDRLDRLVSSRAPSPAVDFDALDVVERLVESHRTRGLAVECTAVDARAVGDPDDFAEVVNILLENARRHGGGSVRLELAQDDDGLRLVCTDEGPGVAVEDRERIFSSGVRGPASGGQGLGLAIARRLMVERGGSLELLNTVTGSVSGATFVARLPMSEKHRVAPSHSA